MTIALSSRLSSLIHVTTSIPQRGEDLDFVGEKQIELTQHTFDVTCTVDDHLLLLIYVRGRKAHTSKRKNAFFKSLEPRYR